MFLNYSNHVSTKWCKEQIEAAKKYGEVVDLQFPNIPADYTEEQVAGLAEAEFNKIKKYNPDCVLCQGEMTFCFYLVRRLKEAGIKVVAACSERKVVEETLADGSTSKQAIFSFVRFRQY